jgi:hypothetical protein
LYGKIERLEIMHVLLFQQATQSKASLCLQKAINDLGIVSPDGMM